MVTRHWKTIKGALESYPYNVTTQGSNATYTRVTLNNVKTIDGNLFPNVIFMYSRTTNVTGNTAAFMVSRNNTTLFTYCDPQSLDNNPSTVMYNSSHTNTHGGGGFTVCVGSGNTPTTIDDFNLESPLLTKVKITGMSRDNFEYDEKTGNWVNYITIRGVAQEDASVSEVGIFKSVFYQCVGTLSNGAMEVNSKDNFINILAVREVLSTPLDLAAGDAFVITIKVEM